MAISEERLLERKNKQEEELRLRKKKKEKEIPATKQTDVEERGNRTHRMKERKKSHRKQEVGHTE